MLKTFPSEKISINGRNLFVRRTGGELPALILAHGFTDSGYYWSRLAADLADRYNVIMPDMLGHGQSDPLPGVTTVESYADDVVAILDYYGVSKAVIGGHSMGGITTSVAAAKYPERFTAVFLEDPAWNASAPDIPEEFLINYPHILEWKRDAEVMRAMTQEEVQAKIEAENPGWHPDDWEMYISDKTIYDMTIFEQLNFAVRSKWKEHLASIKVPLLLVFGEQALGSIVNDEFAELILSIAPDGHMAKIEGAGHGIHRERYEPFRDAVVEFLTKMNHSF